MEGYLILEIGGGSVPSYCKAMSPNYVNLDARPVANVDIVHDLNILPLPLQSESFDKVYSRYCLEHLSWRVIPDFIKELHRVLKPGGLVYLVTSNLKEQAAILSREREWSFKENVCMIFGDLDYPENSHKGSMSPELAVRTFKEAGFRWTVSYPYWQWHGDQVLEAVK